jgi:WD40 repeat protein
VATTRWEYIDRLRGEAPELRAFDRPEVISPLDTGMLLEVITEPLRLRGITLDPRELARRMVADTGTGTALPLLAYTLHRLTEPFPPEGGTLTAAMYDAEGGVRGALARQADAALAALEPAPGRAAVLAALLQLASLGEGDKPMRHALRAEGLPEDVTRILDAFVERRLVVARDERTVYEVAHEALFTVWKPLADAFAASLEGLRTLAELQRDAAAWNRSGRTAGDYLWVGERLDRAAQLTRERPWLPETVSAFVAASTGADRARRESAATQLAERALEQLDSDPELSLLLCRAAALRFGYAPRLALALQRALEASRIEFRLRTMFLEAAAISGDGRSVVLARPASDPPAPSVFARSHVDVPRSISRQDVVTGNLQWARDLDAEQVGALGISPDGALVVCLADETLFRLDGATGTILSDGVPHPGSARRIAWSQRGDYLVVSDACAVLYGASGEPRWSARAEEEVPFHDGCLAPSGRSLALSNGNGTRLWSEAGTSLGATPHGGEVALFDDMTLIRTDAQGERVVYQPWHEVETQWAEHGVRGVHHLRVAAMTVLAAGDDGLEVWPVWHPEDGFRLPTRSRPANVALSADGGHALIWSRYGVTVWDLGPRGQPERVIAVPGHATWCGWLPGGAIATLTAEGGLFEEREQVAQAPGKVLGASNDGRFVLLDRPDRPAVLDVQTRLVRKLDALQGWLQGAGFSTDGNTVAVTHGTRIELWDVPAGERLRVIGEHDDEEGDTYRGAALSPDGTLLATASQAGGRSFLWRIDGGERLQPLRARSVRFAPDGAAVLAANWGALRVLRTRDGEALGEGAVDGEATDLDIAGDGSLAVTVDSSGCVAVWTLPDLERVAEFRTPARPVRACFDDGAARVLAAYRDGSLRIWDVRTFEALLDRAASSVFRNLSDEECRRFGLG